MQKQISSADLDIFFESILQTKQKNKTSGAIKFTLTKNQLISPMLEECLKQGYFNVLAKDNKVEFICDDGNLFFNEDETQSLLKNYEYILQYNGDLLFKETIVTGTTDEKDSRDNLVSLEIETRYETRSFREIMQINNKLRSIARKVNNYKGELSPFEKYLLCFEIVHNIDYYYEGGIGNPSQSFVDTVKLNKGCCVGKAQYLRALLTMVGINACDIKVDPNREYAIQFYECIRNGYNNEITDDDTGKVTTYDKHIKNLLSKLKKNKYKYELGHEFNAVEVYDPKYDICGIFCADASIKDVINDCFIPMKDNVDTLFNFSSLFACGSDICSFLDKTKTKPTQKLSQSQKESIEKEYINLAKTMLIRDLKYYLTTTDGANTSRIQPILDKFEKCKTLIEMQQLFENFDTSKGNNLNWIQKNIKSLNDTYNDFCNNGSFKRTLQAVNAKIGLNEAQCAEPVSFEKLQKAQQKVYKIYEELFVNAEPDIYERF